MADYADDGVVVQLRPRPATAGHRAVPDGATVVPFGDTELPSPSRAAMTGWDRAAATLAFARGRMSGSYDVDEYGFDADLTDSVTLPALRLLYERWFRAEVNGIEHIPSRGGALLVANHSGGLWALDAAMTAVAVRTEHPAGRRLRMLGDEFLFRVPGLGAIARRSGATLACDADARRLLRAGELVGAWPEGARGLGKRFRDRYQVQRFGRAGFVASAAAAGVPIVPVSIVGAEEIHPVLGNVQLLARLLDLPYLPLTATFPWLGPLGLIPLPTKWYLEFGAPISTGGVDPADPAAVGDLADEVRDEIQATLYRLLGQRRSLWR